MKESAGHATMTRRALGGGMVGSDMAGPTTMVSRAYRTGKEGGVKS